MRQKALCLVAVVLFSLSSAGRAVEAPPKLLPDTVQIHLSIKSFVGLVGHLDTLAAAATENTSQALPPGFVTMMVQMQFPLSPDAWKAEEEMHLLVGHDSREQFAMVFGVDNLDDLITVFEELNATAEDVDTEGAFAAAKRVTMPGNQKAMELVDLGGGKVALSESWRHADILLNTEDGFGRKLVHPQDADVYIAVDLSKNPRLDEAFASLFREIEANRQDFIGEMTKAGIVPGVAEAFLNAGVKIAHFSRDEIVDKTRAVAFTLSFLPEDIHIAMLADASEDSLVAEMGANLSKKPNVSNPLAAQMTPGAVSIAVTANIEDVLPNGADRIAEAVVDLIGMPYPAQKESFTKNLKEAWANLDGSTVMQSYVRENASFNVYFVRTRNAEASIRATTGIFGVINDMMAASVASPDDGVRFIIEQGEINGDAFTRIAPDFNNPEMSQKFMDFLEQQNPDLNFDAGLPGLFRAYFGTKHGVMVIVAGSGVDDETYSAMAKMLDTVDHAMLSTESADRVIALLANGQLSIGAIEADKLQALILYQAVRVKGQGNANGYTLERAETDLRRSKEVIGFANGAKDGRVGMELVVPIKAINLGVRNYESYLRGEVPQRLGNAEEKMEVEEGEIEILVEEDNSEA